VSFASDSPGSIRTSVPISGTLESERILGIDVRPKTSGLYGLGSANLLYLIDQGTGRARPVGPLFDVPIRGSSYGFDFDPVADRVRVVSDSELNMRLNPDSGRVVDYIPASPSVQPDKDLSYAAGDAGAAAGDPTVGSSAYTPGAQPQLFGIDTARDALVRQDPPDEGVLRTVGSLGADAIDPVGFDVGSDGTAWVAFLRRGRREQELLAMDLATGRVRHAVPPQRGRRRGPSGVGTFLGRRRDPIRALAAAGRVADDTTRPGFLFTARRSPSVRDLLRGRALVLLVSCTEACRATAALRSGRRVVGRAAGEVRERAGVVTLRLRVSRSGRRVVRRNPGRRLKLGVSARDAAGNVSRTP
jgi:hypothetical protein